MIYKIKVSLKDIRPQIWRRIQVHGNTTLYELHRILQVVMGWEDYHLHEFKIDGESYGPPQDEFTDNFGFSGSINEKRVKLSEVIRAEKVRFLYTYDFGDDWRHELLVEKILLPEKGQKYPVCLKGKRACPPEDCGGVWGYQYLVEAREHPDDPECHERLEWAGEFDPEEFDLDEINSCLKKTK
jgi:hypothetical protein